MDAWLGLLLPAGGPPLPPGLLLGGWVIALGVLALVLVPQTGKPPLSRWLLAFGAGLALWALHQIHLELLGVLKLFFLGSVVVTHMLGWRWALGVTASVAVIGAFSPGGLWLAPPLDFLASGALPVLVTVSMLALTLRFLPAHFFIYIFVNGFLTAALAVVASQLVKAAVTGWAGLARWPNVIDTYLASLPLMMFGEAFFTGGTLAILAVYRPAWLASYDEERILGPRRGRDA